MIAPMFEHKRGIKANDWKLQKEIGVDLDRIRYIPDTYTVSSTLEALRDVQSACAARRIERRGRMGRRHGGGGGGSFVDEAWACVCV